MDDLNVCLFSDGCCMKLDPDLILWPHLLTSPTGKQIGKQRGKGLISDQLMDSGSGVDPTSCSTPPQLLSCSCFCRKSLFRLFNVCKYHSVDILFLSLFIYFLFLSFGYKTKSFNPEKKKPADDFFKVFLFVFGSVDQSALSWCELCGSSPDQTYLWEIMTQFFIVQNKFTASFVWLHPTSFIFLFWAINPTESFFLSLWESL